jgi:50S ribosome-binding GTPase
VKQPASGTDTRQGAGAFTAALAVRVPGSADVMRRFEALQAQPSKFDEDDDFAFEEREAKAPARQAAAPPAGQPRDTRVRTARYVSSATTLAACPAPTMPEFAVIGRSNVGKSSLINMLTRNKKLALTSKQPGATACMFCAWFPPHRIDLVCPACTAYPPSPAAAPSRNLVPRHAGPSLCKRAEGGTAPDGSGQLRREDKMHKPLPYQ